VHGDILGVIISVLFIGIGYVAHNLIKKKDAEIARKVLHIWVGNWFFIFKYFFESTTLAIVGLFVFACINLLLEIRVFHSHRYGTIYYPLSIILLLCFYDGGFGTMKAIGCAIISMAYGDGFAAILGSKIKSPYMPFLYDKTVLGSATMFVVSALVLFIVGCSPLYAVAIGFIAAIAEAYSPFGLDNVFVPCIVFFLVTKLC